MFPVSDQESNLFTQCCDYLQLVSFLIPSKCRGLSISVVPKSFFPILCNAASRDASLGGGVTHFRKLRIRLEVIAMSRALLYELADRAAAQRITYERRYRKAMKNYFALKVVLTSKRWRTTSLHATLLSRWHKTEMAHYFALKLC